MIIQTNPLCFIGETETEEVIFPFNQETQLVFSSVAQSRPTLCNSMNHSTQGLPVHHQLPESTQTHVH